MDGARRRANQYDVRPWLLALCDWQDYAAIAPCVAYGRNYLDMWCTRCGLHRDADLLEAAAVDALLAVYWGRSRRRCGRPTIAERTADLRVAPATFLMLKRVAEDAFRRRLREAAWERLTPAEWQTACESRKRPPAFADSACRAA